MKKLACIAAIAISVSSLPVAQASGCMGPTLEETQVLSRHPASEAKLYEAAVTEVLDPRRTRAVLTIIFAALPNPALPPSYVQIHDLNRVGALPPSIAPAILKALFQAKDTWVEIIEDRYFDDCTDGQTYSQNLRITLPTEAGGLEFRTDYPAVPAAPSENRPR